MQIHRDITQKLIVWKQSSKRKPLILQGARQVGKTWILKSFGQQNFPDMAYFNFEAQPDLKQFFQQTKEPNRIIRDLSLVVGKPIVPNETLIIFDEIQECNEALNSLKYFQEEAPAFAIACAGSLLGVALNRGASFPVGKVDFQTIHPLNFREFLSVSSPQLSDYLHQFDYSGAIPDIFFNQLVQQFNLFLISGGMPEAVITLTTENSFEKTDEVLSGILNAYRLDFSKHTENNNIQKINHIWESLPSQLARENKKFVYRTVKSGARAREYEDALLWLDHAGLIHRIFRNEKPALPLSAYDDLSAFKVYLSDVGLLRRLAGLSASVILDGSLLYTEFKGSLIENYVLQNILPIFETLPRYWTSGNLAEIDFLVQFNSKIIPIEVKSNENIRSKSLSVYEKQYQPSLRIRYSLKNFSFDGNLINIPLFLTDRTWEIINRINPAISYPSP
ncbi:MAG: AAA family ATPase [Smithellaceae bacterium]|jgi:hypothetical protein|nr:AAA family ATPase [Smithellaceae bacterium]